MIDDAPPIREALSSLLRSVGLGVGTFGSAQEFLHQEQPETFPTAWCSTCAAFDSVLNRIEKVLIAERLREELHRAGLHSPHGHRDVTVTGDENDGNTRPGSGELTLKIEPAEALSDALESIRVLVARGPT